MSPSGWLRAVVVLCRCAALCTQHRIYLTTLGRNRTNTHMDPARAQEPEADGQGRLWTPGVIEMFRFLTQQVELAASVRDAEVVRNVAAVALQVMQRCGVCCEMLFVYTFASRAGGRCAALRSCAAALQVMQRLAISRHLFHAACCLDCQACSVTLLVTRHWLLSTADTISAATS
jgi:hypothetical protein